MDTGLAALEQCRQAEYRRTVLGDLEQPHQKARSHSEEPVTEQQRQRQTLTAPVDGVVQQISVHTVCATVRTRAASAGADDTAARGATDVSQATARDLVYAAHASLDRTMMPIENKQVSVVPGMAVTVEVKTGSRRVIEYLLSPLLRYKQEAMRER